MFSNRPAMSGIVRNFLGHWPSVGGLGLPWQPFSFNAAATSFSSCAQFTPEDEKASGLVISVLTSATLCAVGDWSKRTSTGSHY